ncbi:PD-(D/E)XK nuclease family protein [Patescibacteria group bacterium]|nr:PD-(D/E)XK nuclease family protein [Patescibacteria group bacterium]
MTDTPEKDKFKAVWVSHSSMGDFLKCPKLYFLRNVYKNPKNNHKMTVMTPPLALGQAVHEVVESLSILPVKERLSDSLAKKYDVVWKKVTGEKGGFKNHQQEMEYKERGLAMLKRVEDNPGPILNKAVKIRADGGLPYYWFSEDDDIILCGKIDWLEYLEKEDAIHIIDFKTGRKEEDASSLQLPIYLLLVANTQKRKVKKASYWYLGKEDGLVENELPNMDDAYESVYNVAKRIKLARQIRHFVCPDGGCRYCVPFERVLKGEGKLVGISEYGQDLYILD